MHDSRQRRTAVRAKSVVRNVVILVITVTAALFLIPTMDTVDAPDGAVQAIVGAGN